jgi:O-antigen/teichoic acid export membrane protein
MIQRLKPKSEFNRNVLTLMTGTTIAQAIPVAITPILTRIYTPEDFGLLALFVAVTMVFGSIINARYELAIILPEKDEEAINIAALCLFIAIAISLLLQMLIVIFNREILILLDNEKIGFWLYFVPLSTFMIGLFNILKYLNTRKKFYKDISRASIYKSVSMSFIQIVIGFIKSGTSGLILGQIISQFTSNFHLTKNVLKGFSIKSVSFKLISYLALRYSKFPKFSLWAGLANTSSIQITNILISSVYSISTLGFYSITQRALEMPASVISRAAGQVFFQEATYEKRTTGATIKSFRSALKNLFIVGFIVYSILFFVVEDLFAIFFGESWRVAGSYAQILIPVYFIKFFVSPLTIMNIIFEKNKVGMYWQFLLLLLNIIVIMTAYLLNFNFEDYLNLMVFVIGVHYLIMLFIVSRYNYIKN